MSAEATAVRVWTVETTFVHADRIGEVLPFRAVVAVEDQSGQITRARTIGSIATAGAVTFNTAEELAAGFAELGLTAVEERLPFANHEQATRFAGYFATVVAQNDATQPGSTRQPTADYNCYDFVQHVVRGEAPKGLIGAATQALGEARPGYVETHRPLARGAEGLVVDAFFRPHWSSPRTYLRHRWNPMHTFIGLGRDRNECLSVLDQGGPVAIMSYDQVTQPFDVWFARPTIARARWGLGRIIASRLFPNKPDFVVRGPQGQ